MRVDRNKRVARLLTSGLLFFYRGISRKPQQREIGSFFKRVEEVGATQTDYAPPGRTLGYIMDNKFPSDDSFNNDDSFFIDDSFNRDDSYDDELDYLLWQAEDYLDESYSWGLVRPLSLENKKRYVDSMYRWDCAPVRTVGEMVAGKYVLVNPKKVSDEEMFYALEQLKDAMKERNLHLVFTDHLSDRTLYELIVKQIFPQKIKDFGDKQPPAYWDFCSYEEDEDKRLHPTDDEEVYWSYFASEQKREEFARYNSSQLPKKRSLDLQRDDRVSQEALCFH